MLFKKMFLFFVAVLVVLIVTANSVAMAAEEKVKEPISISVQGDKSVEIKNPKVYDVYTRFGEMDVRMDLLEFNIAGGKNVSTVDLIRWNYFPKNGPSTYAHEVLFWLHESGSKVGPGIFVKQDGGVYAEVNGMHKFPVMGSGQIYFFWQAEKGLSGQKTPDIFQVNSLDLTFPVGKKLRIGPDSQLVLQEGQKLVYRVGGVAIIKWGVATIKVRVFPQNDTTSPKCQIWLIMPLQ